SRSRLNWKNYGSELAANPGRQNNAREHPRDNRRWLTTETLSVHLLAGSIGGGADTLHPEFEVVRIGGVLERRFVINELLLEEVVERLVETLHAVWCPAKCQ